MRARPAEFTAASTALVLIDHQVGTMQLIKTLPLDLVTRMTLALAKAAVILDLPVFLTSSQETAFQGPLLPELQKILPQAHAARVQRSGLVNAWEDDRLREGIEATGRCDLVMAGVTTDVCLVYPAISAVNDGHNVQAVLDASGSPYALSEETARRRMEQAGVVLTATNSVIAELARDWSTPAGQKLIELLVSDVLPPLPVPPP